MTDNIVEFPVTPETLADIHLAVDSLPQNGVAAVTLITKVTKPSIRQRRGFMYWCRISAKAQGLPVEDMVDDGFLQWGLASQWKKKYLATQFYEDPIGKHQNLWRSKVMYYEERGEASAVELQWYNTSSTWTSREQWKTAMEWIEQDHQAMGIGLPVLDPRKSKFRQSPVS